MAELGIVGDAPHFVIDGAGALSRIGEEPVVEWGIGADDRWHFASSEPAVRQQLADDETVVETRLRIPGGDAIHRVLAVPALGSSVARVEVENASPVPVAFAIVIDVGLGPVTVVDDVVLVNGGPIIRADRSVARAVVGSDVKTVRSQIESGAAQPPVESEWPINGSVVGLIFPLPHTAVGRFVTSHSPLPGLPTPNELPPLAAVARGWKLHIEPAMQLVIPDRRLSSALQAARRHLLSGSALGPEALFWAHDASPWVPAVAAMALDMWGHDSEARELLLLASGVDDLLVHARRSPSAAGALLWAWAERLERRPDPDLESVIVPWIEEVAVGLLTRRRWTSRRFRSTTTGDEAWRALGLASAGSLLSRVGKGTVGLDIVEALPRFSAGIRSEGSEVALAVGASRLGVAHVSVARTLLKRLQVASIQASQSNLAAQANGVGALALDRRSQHPEASALLLLATRAAVLAESAEIGRQVALLPAPDSGWLGAPLEVYRAPITAGSVSFGVRWHDKRPALLWDIEIDSGPAESGFVRTISSPILDATWSDERLKGETLLGPTPGLKVSRSSESAQVQRGEIKQIGDETDSFM